MGGWLATRGGETDEIVGYHLEQAHRHWRELGFLGPREQAVGRDAATRLESAARGALQRGDLPGAIALLERATSLLRPEDAARTALLTRLGAVLFEAEGSRTPTACSTKRPTWRAGSTSGASSQAQGSSASSCGYTASRAARPWRTRGMRQTVRCSCSTQHADDFGQSRAWCLRAAIDWLQGQAARADDAWARAAVHAKRADESGSCSGSSLARLCGRVWADSRPSRNKRCTAIREQVRTSAVAVAVTLHPLAALHAMLANFDSARSLIRQGNQILEEVGGAGMQSAQRTTKRLVEMLAGRPEIAEERLRVGYHKLEEMGENALLSTSAACSPKPSTRRAVPTRRSGSATVSERTAATDDLSTQVMWRSVRGKILARQGRGEEALALAREAVRLIERTDLLCDHADALLDLAEVLSLDPHPTADEERTLVLKAVALYEKKGNIVSAEMRGCCFLPRPYLTRNDQGDNTMAKGAFSKRGRYNPTKP